MSGDTLRQLGRALRGEGGGDHWIERLMSDEQRRLFRETQAVMSLLEGFSDYVMDEVGREIVPDVERISARFHERRERKTGFERAVMRLIGMDLKLDQYKKGERFVRAIADRAGPAALTRLWDGPETLPREGEIEAPERWIARVLGPAGPRAGRHGAAIERRGMTEELRRVAGPGHGPGGAPTAIALTPILSARYRVRDLDRIRAAAPGARIVNVSTEGLADGPLDDVEVLLRGWLAADAFDRLLARAPRLAWVHSASAGVERVLTPAGPGRGLVITNARGVFSRPIAEYVLMMILGDQPAAAPAPRAAAGADVAAARGRRAARHHGRHRRARVDRARGRVARDGVRLPGHRDPPAGRCGSGAGHPAGETAEGDEGRPLGEAVFDRVLGPEGLPELLAESDFIVLAAPLTPETENMISAEHARAGQARRVAHQRRPRAGSSTSARSAGRSARARWVARSSTRSARSRSSRPRRSTTCRTRSSRPTRRGRRAGSSIAASSCSATTSAASPPGSRSSTSSIPPSGTDGCRSRSSAWPRAARPRSSTR